MLGLVLALSAYVGGLCWPYLLNIAPYVGVGYLLYIAPYVGACVGPIC